MTTTSFQIGALALWFSGSTIVQDAQRFIPQPDHYVEFSADVNRVRNAVDGTTVMHGRFYMSSDASRRYEWLDASGRVTRIVLRSVKDNAIYTWNANSGWRRTSGAATTEPERPGPHPRPEKMYPKVSETIEGFDLVQHVYSNGGYALEAPQLNFFGLVDRLCEVGGERCDEWRYTRIQLGPQPPELFEPSRQ